MGDLLLFVIQTDWMFLLGWPLSGSSSPVFAKGNLETGACIDTTCRPWTRRGSSNRVQGGSHRKEQRHAIFQGGKFVGLFLGDICQSLSPLAFVTWPGSPRRSDNSGIGAKVVGGRRRKIHYIFFCAS